METISVQTAETGSAYVSLENAANLHTEIPPWSDVEHQMGGTGGRGRWREVVKEKGETREGGLG